MRPSIIQQKISINNKNDRLFPVACQQAVQEMVAQVGFNEASVLATNTVIDATLSLLKEQTSFMDIWEKTINNEDYISEHSFLLAYFSCCVCSMTELKANEYKESLCLASFFHDIAQTLSEI